MDDRDGCLPMIAGMFVAFCAGVACGRYFIAASNTIVPTVTVTTTNGVPKVEINGVEIDRRKAEELKRFYDDVLAKWPEASKEAT